MPHTKFQGNRSFGSGEKKFLFKVFTIYGRGGHAGHVTWMFVQFFVSTTPSRVKTTYEIRLQFAQEFQRRSCLNLWLVGWFFWA